MVKIEQVQIDRINAIAEMVKEYTPTLLERGIQCWWQFDHFDGEMTFTISLINQYSRGAKLEYHKHHMCHCFRSSSAMEDLKAFLDKAVEETAGKDYEEQIINNK